MFKKLMLSFLLLIVCSIAYSKTTKLELGLGYIPNVQFTPIYVGIENGFYEEEGIELEIRYGYGLNILSLLQTQKIDIGLSDSDELIISGSKNLNLKAVMGYYTKSPVSIVAKSSVIKKPSNFKGKTIGVPDFYGSSYIGALAFIDKYNLKGKVKLEKVGYNQVAALLTDKVAGVVVFYNNEAVKIENIEKNISRWDVNSFSDFPGASFITSDDIISKKEEEIRKFVKATIKAIEYTAENKEEALNIAYEYIKLPKSQYEEQLVLLDKTCDLFFYKGEVGALQASVYRKSIRYMKKLDIINSTYSSKRILEDMVE